MNLWSKLKSFARAEDGLGTVEWAAVAGAVVVGGILAVWLVSNGLKAPATAISSRMTACTTQGCK